MIALDNVSFKYPNGLEAIKEVNAQITPGLYLLLGENGAGKTTLLHLMAGLLFPSAGKISVNSADVIQRLPSMYQDLLFLGESSDIPTATIRKFAAIHSPFYPGFSEELFTSNLTEFGLTGNEPMSSLSFGTRHKAILAYVLSLGCKTLLLDEPANGLDINARKTLRSILARVMDENSTVLVSTHTTADFQALFDGVIILLGGRLVFNMSVADITERVAFTITPVPPINSIYMEQELGMFHCIVPNEEGRDTDIDFGLLYSALLSPKAEKLITYLTK